MIVDSHCHLNFEEFKNDFQDVLYRAEINGVKYMQTISTTLSEFPEVLKIAETFDNIFCSVGLHPCNVFDEDTPSVDSLLKLSSHKKVIGLGETGLDYYHQPFDKDLQVKSFKNHIIAAQENGLPVIIHSRDADSDTLSILQEMLLIKQFKFLIHCFTGSMEFANEIIKLGGYISFSGIISFKNAKDLKEIVKIIPLDRMLIETDSPYLAPAPFRGKRNEPALTLHVAEAIADIKNENLENVKKLTTRNFVTLFNKSGITL